jgi:hypothetical protein
MAFSLENDVGIECTSWPDDVRALHQRFTELGYPSVPNGDTLTEQTVELINLIQSIADGRGAIRGDGQVDVSHPYFGSVYDWVRARNAPQWERLPRGVRNSSIQLGNVDATQGAVHATSFVTETIRRAGTWYQDNYRDEQPDAPPLTIGGAAGAPGTEPLGHEDHATGVAFDVLLPRLDGSASHGISWMSPDHVRKTMRAMLQAVRHQPMVREIYFGDEALAADNLCTTGQDLDHVAHVEVEPLLPEVEYDEPNAELVERAVSFLGGDNLDPADYPMTADGFAQYLSDQGIEHFDADEFLEPHHPDTATGLGYALFLPPQGWWPRGAALGLLADRLRERIGEPVVLRNWWRPRPYNAEVATARQSDHITAHALDLDFPSPEDREVAQNELESLRREAPWLEMSLGTGGNTIHLGVLSYRKQRSWTY